MQYEYKVIPAPRKGRKARGVKGAEERFSHTLQDVMNDLAIDGWEFLRSETLPSEERSGLTSSTTVFRSVLVFRRARDGDIGAFAPELLEDHSDSAAVNESDVDKADDLAALPEGDWSDDQGRSAAQPAARAIEPAPDRG